MDEQRGRTVPLAPVEESQLNWGDKWRLPGRFHPEVRNSGTDDGFPAHPASCLGPAEPDLARPAGRKAISVKGHVSIEISNHFSEVWWLQPVGVSNRPSNTQFNGEELVRR